MSEDEAFELLEEDIRRREYQDTLKRAQTEAQEFVQDHAAELGIMTLRKAFEIGYRFGYCDGKSNAKN
jgi:hypothetical protein